MLIEEHITTYLHSLEEDHSALLETMRAEAKEQEVPIIRREMESFIRMLLRLSKTERILEIGTGIGYSAVLMASCSPDVKQIVTMENYPPRIERAQFYLARYKEEHPETEIRLVCEDAAQAIKKEQVPFDFIFLDGPKAQYEDMLPDLLRLLRPGGVLLADNVLQEGNLVQSRYAQPRRERTIHKRMRDFLYTVKHHPELETAVLTVGDGVSVSIKKKM